MPTVPVTVTVIPTVPTVPPTLTPVPTVPTVTPVMGNTLFISSNGSGKVDGIKYQDEDLLAYALDTDSWSLVVDGSDLGLRKLYLNAFYVMADGTILMSFNKAFELPDLGVVDDSDILRFIPTQLGGDTQGSFAWFFDGSDVGLTTGGEDIDAIAFDPLGNLVISTKGSFRVDELRGKDEDLFVFKSVRFGEDTDGTWELYFDGSNVGLTKGNEDINGAWIDPIGQLYLTTKGDFTAEGSSNSIHGDRNDIFICTLIALGSDTDCSFQPFFDGDAARFSKRITGIALGNSTVFAPLWRDATPLDEEDDEVDEDEAGQYDPVEEEEVAAAATDEEIDLYDQENEAEEEVTSQIFLPLINSK
ncbi:MAG: hypothetical protein R3E79_17290 [Caldilineaceae bacterium]